MAERGFLTRWSQRKAAAKAEAEKADPPILPEPQEAQPVAVTETSEPPKEAEQATVPLDLPDVESLTAESDFTQFMGEGVPEELKKLALRKLWRSNPVLANLDGLNEYDEDYSTFVPLAEGVAEEIHKMLFERKEENAGDETAQVADASEETEGESADAENLEDAAATETMDEPEEAPIVEEASDKQKVANET